MASILVETGGTPRKIGFAIVVVLVGTGIGFWVWWAFWGNHSANSGTPDHWLDVMTGLGAAVTAAGVLTGGVLAARYGRKATVQLSAEAYWTPDVVLVSVRPSVMAVGIFRVRFKESRGAVLTTTELWMDTKGGVNDGGHWDQDAVFGPSFVEGGETLTTTTVFPVGKPQSNVVGWRVSIAIQVPRRWYVPGDAFTWADRVFVPVPIRPTS
jgi:hypothetical protein